MPSRRLFSTRTRRVQSPSTPSNDSSPNQPSTSPHPQPPTMPQPSYPDYLNESAGPGWDATLVLASIIRDMPTPLSGPLTQVVDCRGGVRVTKFLESFVGGLKGSNISDNTAVASSLFILRRNLVAIRADAERWSSLNLLSRYVQRDQIMTAISRHGRISQIVSTRSNSQTCGQSRDGRVSGPISPSKAPISL
ncbi:hypothetical protein BS47DRAFT_1457266 [Hydnum rufescens UP504]|uniref:Uncharacterized protein n=1 Tax=Hydnum rufescens UP504 TaxID=1448309 RepID=A0A9P6AXI9_9AGAM|nr:hypothetical protein BS47DRAFT_1457266 [Hydnum rufescens UP504]